MQFSGPKRSKREQRQLSTELIGFLKKIIAHSEQIARCALQSHSLLDVHCNQQKNLFFIASLATHKSFLHLQMLYGVSRGDVDLYPPVGSSLQGYEVTSMSRAWETSPIGSSFQGLHSSVAPTLRTFLQGGT